MSPRRPESPPLDRESLADEPLEQFAKWFEEARAAVPLAEAMTVATVDADGAPDARMVLLKGFAPDGFRFFTNYESAKGDELAANPRAALVIYWRELDRQVRIRGEVERLSSGGLRRLLRESAPRQPDRRRDLAAEPTDRARRARKAIRGAGRQSSARRRCRRPEHWGGYLLRPDAIEFWQGRESRMHDRFVYSRRPDGWGLQRLAP